MTNVKVKVSKEVAEAIEALRNDGESDALILRVMADPTNRWAGAKSSILNSTSFDLVAKALYVGYEVEKSPEELVAIEYKRLQREIFHADCYDMRLFYRRRADAIKYTLDTLGLKIPEVNA